MKILVQIPYDWDNVKEVPNFLIDTIKHKNVTIFSPSFYAEAYLYQGAHDFTARMLSIALTLEKDVELIPWTDKPVQLYIGPAPRSIEFDEIVVYKKHTLSTQEEYLKSVLHNGDYSNVFYEKVYNSEEGSIFFEELDKLAEHILLMANAYAN